MSTDSENDLIAYGTPLEPLEEDEIPLKKPRLLEDQVVKDKQGRRRFHGAFTGGFSAGFFNTVGSLEGWTPSSFKSSKSKKQEICKQKPEDFMDEEDVSTFGIAPLVLKAKQDYTEERKKEAVNFLKFPTLGSYVFKELLKPVKETMGIKLLKKMGWKPGQGVGPRLKEHEKRNLMELKQKIYGCELPPGTLENSKENLSEEFDSQFDDTEFAPSDYEPIVCEARTNFYGLGYEGLNKRLILSVEPSKKKFYSIVEKNKKMSFGSQAFGVGAFEEEDDDIYLKDDMSSYDFSLGNDQASEACKSTEEKFVPLDGVIEGFTLEITNRIRKFYPLPRLPKGFNPQHKIRISRFDQILENNITKSGSVKLDTESRKRLFKETIEDTVTEETRKKAENLVKRLVSNVEICENQFKPFSSNPDKQERYDNYLKLIKLGKKEFLNDLQPLSMTNLEREREKAEFEKAALLFRPLTGGMEDRFSTATQADDLSDPLAVVEKFQSENDEKKKAAQMNMFGLLTRKTEDWAPAQILCKRFNIPEPKNRDNVEKKKEKFCFNLFDTVDNSKNNTKNIMVLNNPVDRSLNDEANSIDSKLFQAKHDEKTNVKDKADLFKAIFLASDDEEEDKGMKVDNEKNNIKSRGNEVVELVREKELNKEGAPNHSGLDEVLYEEKLINSKRNLSPPRGIFENIDFELLSSSTQCKKTIVKAGKFEENKSSESQNSVKVEHTGSSELIYGPKMPEQILVNSTFAETQYLPDEEMWVEKKTHDKHKKNKKHKKTSHKSKHKHKKKKK